jgi:ASC-1-like (ASCH) protein
MQVFFQIFCIWYFYVIIIIDKYKGLAMATHNMKLETKPYFDLVQNGSKTIELRLWDEKRRQIKPGDEIIFRDGERVLTVTVTGLVIAENFDSLFDMIDVRKTGLGDNKNDAVKIMEQFYDKSAQEKFGVVGIVIS